MNSAPERPDLSSPRRVGGATLLIGTLLTVATILAEFWVGWSTPSASAGLAARVETFLEAWPILSRIFALQMAGAFLMSVAALILMTAPLPRRRIPSQSVLLGSIVISGVLIVMSFATALGAYPPAFKAFAEAPELTAALAGESGVSYRAMMGIFGLCYLVLFVQEGLSETGCVPRFALFIVLAVIVAAIVIAALGLMLAKTVGVVAFAAPALLGFFLWRNGA